MNNKSDYPDRGGSVEKYTVRKLRDLSIISVSRNRMLVIACDSNASIGEKPMDYKKISYEEMGVSALKVPLMEVLATGAAPLIVVDNLCVEMEGFGRRIIAAMRHELERHGMADKVQLTGSTEDNMPTSQTGVGVTVIGMLCDRDSRIGKTQKGDVVVCVGVPRDGIIDKYSEFQSDVANIGTVLQLINLPFVHEILPVGSKGVAYEAEQLCKTVNLSFASREESGIDFYISAGSSTTVLCSLQEKDFSKLNTCLECPCDIVGEVV